MTTPAIWSVEIREPAKTNERKGWLYRYLILAASSDEALAQLRAQEPQHFAGEAKVHTCIPVGRIVRDGRPGRYSSVSR